MSLVSSSKLPSEQKFGLLFIVVFAAAGAYGLYRGWAREIVIGCFVASAMFVAATVLRPRILAPLNRAWFRLGMLLGKIVNPIVLGVIFFGLLTPIAIVARLLGRDELKLKPRVKSTYWIVRDPPGPTSDSFKNQF